MRNLLKFFALAFIVSIGTASAQVSSPVGPGPASGGVTSVTGTTNEITASAPTGAITLSLPAALTFTGKTVTGGTFSGPTVTNSFTATGLVTVADLVSSATTVNGQTCTLGSTCTVASVATATNLAGGMAGALAYQTGAGATGFISAVATGSVLLSAGTGTVPAYGALPLTAMATQATNTVVGNATSGSAAPTALAVGTCSTSSSALIWTTNTGFGCNTAINAATLGGATFAAPGPIGSGTASTGAFTTLSIGTSATFPTSGSILSTGHIGIGTAGVSGYWLKALGAGASGNQFSLDNDGGRYTEQDFLNNTALKAFLQYDNTASTFFVGSFVAGASTVITSGNGTAAVTFSSAQAATFAGTIVSTSTDAASSTGGALQVAGGASIAKRFWIPAISASAGLQTAVLCQSSGGEMIADSVACLASSRRWKQNIMPLTMQSAQADILGLKPISYFWKPSYNGKFQKDPNYNREEVGLIAEDVAKVDPRLVFWEKNGKTPRGVRYDRIAVVLLPIVQQQQVDIAALHAENSSLRAANANETGLLHQMNIRLQTLERTTHTRQARN